MPNKKTHVRTNSTPGSIKEVHLTALTFQQLWDAYPNEEDPFHDPKTGEVPAYADNQCAIRLSITMHNVGVEMKSFDGEGQILTIAYRQRNTVCRAALEDPLIRPELLRRFASVHYETQS